MSCVEERRCVGGNDLLELRKAALQCVWENFTKLHCDSSFLHSAEELITNAVMANDKERCIESENFCVLRYLWILEETGNCDSMLLLLLLATRVLVSTGCSRMVKLYHWIASFQFKRSARPQMDLVWIANRDSNWNRTRLLKKHSTWYFRRR